MATSYFLIVVFLALASSQAIASDPSPQQDFCFLIQFINFVSSSSMRTVKVNGFICKDPRHVTADDFFKAADLDKPRNTKGKVGSNVTLISAMQLAGLSTLGISLARIDFAPLGENPPHTHPRATEILTVLEGTLYVGFVTSNLNNTLFAKVLNKGYVFVFPKELIHFQFNPVHDKPAVALAAVAKTLGLLPLPIQSLDQSHQSLMMFWPRHSKWRRGQLSGSRLNSGRTTTTELSN
ncbi:hypothetical protein HU200_056060 [Digitaria exilis]|uniref:Germin-like protein n=1 Tax=Digitaria exilis TaxID=1010633 RepID=A0A835AHM0_9POAL|nr:hypothetical protein HU200_056060 [Digitaria exilis]